MFASIIALALPYAVALDINGGVINTNTGGFSNGYLTTSNDNPANPNAIVDIFAWTSVPIGTTAGESYSDFQTGKIPYTPNPVTATKSGLTPYPNPYDLYAFAGGHVQTGIKTTATTTAPAPAIQNAEATARIYARSSQAGGSLDGNAFIESTLTLSGKSEGYAIASGTAGYTGTVEATSTIARNKIDGMVGGTTYLSGDSNQYKEIAGNPITYAYTTAEGESIIYSSAFSAGPLGGLTSAEAGFDYYGIIDETLVPTAVTTSYMGGNADGQVMIAPAATATAWDQTLPIMDDSNARAKASVDADSVAAIVKTTQAGDSADSYAAMYAYADRDHVETTVDTGASVARTGALGTKITAEAFINGGSWSALDRTTSFNTMSAYGTMGSYFNGMASGAHLVSTDAGGISSDVQFVQFANMAETHEIYEQNTDGPLATVKINDDAGSYFSQGGYVTSVSGVRVTGVPISTSIASGYDINWVNGAQTSVFNYGEGFALTDSPAGSATIDIVRTPNNAARTNNLHKNFGQV